MHLTSRNGDTSHAPKFLQFRARYLQCAVVIAHTPLLAIFDPRILDV